MKAPPNSTKRQPHLTPHQPRSRSLAGLAGIDVRYCSRLAYVDGCLEDGDVLKLCRLSYRGSAIIYGFEIYRASHDDYEDSLLRPA